MRRHNRGGRTQQSSVFPGSTVPQAAGGIPFVGRPPISPTTVKQVAQVEAQLCTGCGRCAQVCPAQAISFNEQGKAVVNPYLCRGCQACVSACPSGAIQMTTAA